MRVVQDSLETFCIITRSGEGRGGISIPTDQTFNRNFLTRLSKSIFTKIKYPDLTLPYPTNTPVFFFRFQLPLIRLQDVSLRGNAERIDQIIFKQIEIDRLRFFLYNNYIVNLSLLLLMYTFSGTSSV